VQVLLDQVRVILDTNDTPACARWFGRRHDLDRGRITVRITPPATQRSVARDVLRSLGKRFSMPESPAQLADAWSLAAIWLDAEHVRDVFVLRAHLLDEQATLQLLAACDTAHALPWLIIAGTEAPPALMELLDQVLLNPFHEPGIASRVRSFEQTAGEEGAPRPRPRARRDRPWPPLPDDEFWSFRASCADLLDDEDFRRLDAEMFTGRMIALEWIERRTEQTRCHLAINDIHGLLAGIYASATSAPQALARLRGAQIALFLCGALVYIPAAALTAAAAANPAPLDRAATELLRAFSATRLAAAGVLSLASAQPARRLLTVNLQSVSHDAEEVSLDGRSYPIAFHARAMLRAHVLARAREGAKPDDALFADPHDRRERISVNALHGVIARLCRTTGLAFNADLGDRHLTPRWPLEDHVTIELLESASR